MIGDRLGFGCAGIEAAFGTWVAIGEEDVSARPSRHGGQDERFNARFGDWAGKRHAAGAEPGAWKVSR